MPAGIASKQDPPSAGIDTWSFGWYLREGSRGDRAANALAQVPARRSRWLSEAVEGHRVGYFADSRFLVAEGHPAPEGLAPADPDHLGGVIGAVADGLAELGVRVPRESSRFDRAGSPGFAGVRRVDATVDLVRKGPVGRAVLEGCAAVIPDGRLAAVVRRARGSRSVETVAWQGARGVQARVYDKGVESGSHDRGERVRLEDQRRFQAGARLDVGALGPELVGNMFRRRFAPLVRATKGIKVTNSNGVADRLKQAVKDGEITTGQAIDAAGYLLLESAGVGIGSRMTRYRHRRIAEEVGLVLVEEYIEGEEFEVDLGCELEEAMEAW